jgi:hypothetical protein
MRYRRAGRQKPQSSATLRYCCPSVGSNAKYKRGQGFPKPQRAVEVGARPRLVGLQRASLSAIHQLAMHILISWDIHASGARRNEINAKLKECVSGYSWVRPLTTLYIVQFDDLEDRELIKAALVDLCGQFPREIYFIMSPAMEGGLYNGWLPKRLWPKIRQRTGET